MKLLPTLFLSVFALPYLAIGQDDDDGVWYEDSSKVDCLPRQIQIGEPLHILLGGDHFDELSVHRDADNEVLFLVVKNPPEDMHSLMKPEELSQTSSIVIDKNTTGFEWKVGGTNVKLFSLPGKYTFTNSPILQSGVGGIQCTIFVKNH